MKVLDLFCGLGGWSKGLADTGHDVTGVDIVDVGYPYRFIQMDVRLFHADRGEFDVIVGSPPCRNFSIITSLANTKCINGTKGAWKRPPNGYEGLELVAHFLRIVSEVQPKYWLMENVPGLEKWIGKAPIRSELKPHMYRCFWGNFPPFLVPMKQIEKPRRICDTPGKLRSWKNAIIPYPTAKAFAEAIRGEKNEKKISPGS